MGFRIKFEGCKLGIEKKHKTYFNIVLSTILIFMFLAPMALKLDHSLTFHAEVTVCEQTTTHIHSENSHNDFLDIFFQPVFEFDLNSNLSLLKKYTSNFEIFNDYFVKKVIHKNLNVRGPPF